MNKKLVAEYIESWIDNCYYGSPKDKEALEESVARGMGSDQDLANWGLRPNGKYLTTEGEEEMDSIRGYAHEYMSKRK